MKNGIAYTQTYINYIKKVRIEITQSCMSFMAWPHVCNTDLYMDIRNQIENIVEKPVTSFSQMPVLNVWLIMFFA